MYWNPDVASVFVALIAILCGVTTRLPCAAMGSQGAWNTHVTYLPVPLGYTAAARGADGNIYVFGGFYAVSDQENRVSSATYIYHPRSNTWTSGALMPAPREAAQAVRLNDGRILVMGGDGGCSTTSTCPIHRAVYVYTPRTNRWSLAAHMHTPRSKFGAALGRDGRVYAIGGWDGRSALASVEAYDPRNNRWSPVAGLPQAEEGPAAAVDRKGQIVVMGGFNGQNVSPNIFYANVFLYSGHTWQGRAAMLTPREDLAAALGGDGRIYAIAGFGTNGWVSSVEAYNPETDIWEQVPSLPTARCCLSAVTGPSGQIFALGGDGPRAEVAVFQGARI